MTGIEIAQHRMAMGLVFGCIAWLAAILFAYTASAHPLPREFNYQGRVTDLVGAPVADGPLDLTVSLWDEPGGGFLVWEETLTVQVTDGIVHATLGASNPLDLDFSERYWLEIEVDGDVLDPRMPLHSVPYAIHAAGADTLGGYGPADFLLADDLQPALDGHAADGDAHHDAHSTGLDIAPDDVAATGDISANGALIVGQDADIGDALYAGDVIADNDVVAGGVSLKNHDHDHDHAHGHSHGSLSGVGSSDHHSSTSNGLNITPATVSSSGSVSGSSVSSAGNISASGSLSAGSSLSVGSTMSVGSNADLNGYVDVADSIYAGNRQVYFCDRSHYASGNGDYVEFDDSSNDYRLRRDGGGNWAHLAAGEVKAYHNSDYLRVYHNGTGSYGILENSNGTGIRVNASGFHPWSNKSANLGSSSRKWDDVYADTCHCSAYIENNLMSIEQHDLDDGERASRFPEGSVLVWSEGGMALATAADDPMVQAVANDKGRPIVLGAELIRVMGPVAEGEFLVTSGVEGVAVAAEGYAPGTVIAQALEDHDGMDEALILAMIRKL